MEIWKKRFLIENNNQLMYYIVVYNVYNERSYFSVY